MARHNGMTKRSDSPLVLLLENMRDADVLKELLLSMSS